MRYYPIQKAAPLGKEPGKSGALLYRVSWSANAGLPGWVLLAAPSGGARGPESSTSARINQLGPRSAKAARVQASLTVTESGGFVLSTPKCFCPTVSSNPQHATGAAMSKVLHIPLAAQGMKFQGNYLQVLQKLLTHVLHTHHRELRLLTSTLSQEIVQPVDPRLLKNL